MTYENMIAGFCCWVPLAIFLIIVCIMVDDRLSWRRHRKHIDEMLAMPILSTSGENDEERTG